MVTKINLHLLNSACGSSALENLDNPKVNDFILQQVRSGKDLPTRIAEIKTSMTINPTKFMVQFKQDIN